MRSLYFCAFECNRVLEPGSKIHTKYTNTSYPKYVFIRFMSKFIIVDKTIINEYTGKIEQKPFEVFTRAVRALNWI